VTIGSVKLWILQRGPSMRFAIAFSIVCLGALTGCAEPPAVATDGSQAAAAPKAAIMGSRLKANSQQEMPVKTLNGTEWQKSQMGRPASYGLGGG
jgi:hypothetical protein